MRLSLFLLFLFFFSPIFNGIADQKGLVYEDHRYQTAKGNITSFSRNTVEIFDEQEKRKRSFIDPSINFSDTWHVGDRVRITYLTRGNIVKDIGKLTVLEYKPGQNTGYIFKRPSKH